MKVPKTKCGAILILMLVCLLAIFTFFLALHYWSLTMAVKANTELIMSLQAEQRPLVVINGKYPHIVTTPSEVIVAVDEECSGECGE